MILIIDDNAAKQVAEIVALATLNPFDPQEAQHLDPEGLRRWKMKLMPFTIDIGDYRVTYTHERQPVGICRHIAISISQPGSVAHPAAMAAICRRFNMMQLAQTLLAVLYKQPIIHRGACLSTWTEQFANNRIAVNFLAPLDD